MQRTNTLSQNFHPTMPFNEIYSIENIKDQYVLKFNDEIENHISEGYIFKSGDEILTRKSN